MPDLAQLKNLFLQVLEMPAGKPRRDRIDEVCGTEVELRNYLVGMVDAHEKYATPPPDAATKADAGTASEPRTPALHPGDIVADRYKIIEPLGEGGMGCVYRARRVSDMKLEVALKVIKPGMDTQQVLARFNVERQALALMNHENIAKVLDAGTTDGRPFFVMELVKGQPLTRFCDENKLSVPERLELFAQICSAVQHAHQKGILHRDLKPTNILIGLYDDKPIPKVIDFGLAKAVHQPLTEDSLHTKIGMFVGTWQYTAPEQALLNNLDIDTRADIYSLGVILYELLTGQTPIGKERLVNAAYNEVLRMIREEEPPKPSTKIHSSDQRPSIAALRSVEPVKLERLVRGDLDWIVMKALEKERNRRYETAKDFAEDIRRYLREEPVQAGPPTLRYQLSKLLRKHRGKMIAAALAVAVVTIGAVVATAGWVNAERERRRADRQAAITAAVNAFLQEDLLSEADPVQMKPGREFVSNIRVKTLLDRAAAKVAQRFLDQPLVEAAIRHTIGKAYLGLGDLKAARFQFERAEQLRQNPLGYDDPDRLTSLHELGWTLLHQSQFDMAQVRIQEAAERRLRVLGEDHADTCKSQYVLGLLHGHRGQKDASRKVFEDVLVRQMRMLTIRHPDSLATQRELAAVLPTGESARAKQMLTEVLEIQREILAKDHPDTFTTQNTLAMLYYASDDYDRAASLLGDLVSLSGPTLGEEHPRHLNYVSNQAAVLTHQEKFQDAYSLYQKILPELRRQLGPEAMETIAATQNMSIGLARLGRAVEALPLLETAYEDCLRLLGANDERTRTVLENLVEICRELNDTTKLKRYEASLKKNEVQAR